MECRSSATTSMSFRPEPISPSATARCTSRNPRRVTVRACLSTFCCTRWRRSAATRAVCVILSGTGADGSLGLKAVKEKGGLVIAQDPDEAGYDGMPRSAILTGAVDLVLPVAKIPDALVKYDRRMALTRTQNGSQSAGCRAGLVARDHRSSARKDRPRFQALQAGHAAAPDRAAHGDGGDRDRRHGSLSRNAAERRQASSICSPRICSSMSPASSAIRRCSISWRRRSFPNWSAATRRIIRCASGLPDAARARKPIRLPCFSASRSRRRSAISSCRSSPPMSIRMPSPRAREGLYPETIEADVSAARLARFFTKEDHGYRVLPELRAAVVFTVQDVLADPPFSRLDLVSCRNLLIYLRPEAQDEGHLAVPFRACAKAAFCCSAARRRSATPTAASRSISKPERLYRHIGRSRPGELGFSLSAGDGLRLPARARTRPCRLAPNHTRRALQAAGDGELCAGGSADQPQATNVSIIWDRPIAIFTCPRAILRAICSPWRAPTSVSGFDRPYSGPLSKICVSSTAAAQTRGASAFNIAVHPVLSEGERPAAGLLHRRAGARAKAEGRRATPLDATRVAELEQELEATQNRTVGRYSQP